VPRIVGHRFGDAVHEVHSRGLRQASAGFPGSDSSLILDGCTKIISQAPAPGTKLPKGTTIHVTIGVNRALGPANC
jgi:beta-lactam-binding protein with PASTA domain